MAASPAHAGMYPIPTAASSIGGGFPRTRGDVPPLQGYPFLTHKLPPHTRGCTPDTSDIQAAPGASPAHAGMYRDLAPASQDLRGFPRTRGDVPGPGSRRRTTRSLPPHTRGCTGRHFRIPSRRPASPAHAGMYLSPQQGHRQALRFPRTRGDVPRTRRRSRPPASLPPHTRGCTRPAQQVSRGRRASPAHAGMYRGKAGGVLPADRFPRTRGDVPEPGRGSRRRPWLPPHTRGCTLASPGERVLGGASPAHAGMYPPLFRADGPGVGFPRTRGDVPEAGCAYRGDRALPPHTRGCTGAWTKPKAWSGASPAHAGMYRCCTDGRAVPLRFPRTRGDVPGRLRGQSMPVALPPHTRGCTSRLAELHAAGSASPAHAGMYRVRDGRGGRAQGFPRTRGDVPPAMHGRDGPGPLPPHTRGCT